MKEIKTFWFTNVTGVIGLFVGEDEVTGERKAYIGVASGRNEQADTEYVKTHGSPVSLAFLQDMMALMRKPK
ncbi:unnamed protein product [marine sediment metagenome]|uniref:Uncharacterized protein n=1 Tax=marine sediment metagenome TaxID=412755 RepID=X1VID8_9ZZZZ